MAEPKPRMDALRRFLDKQSRCLAAPQVRLSQSQRQDKRTYKHEESPHSRHVPKPGHRPQ